MTSAGEIIVESDEEVSQTTIDASSQEVNIDQRHLVFFVDDARLRNDNSAGAVIWRNTDIDRSEKWADFSFMLTGKQAGVHSGMNAIAEALALAVPAVLRSSQDTTPVTAGKSKPTT